MGCVNCPSCEHENPDTNRFCGSCGVALERACSACGHANPPDHRFCGQCGEAFESSAPGAIETAQRDPLAYTPKHLADKILTSRSALEGERKQVTVLFADVQGSMELAESIDPEEWRNLLERFFEILTNGVHRFEGTVNQYTGDGIIALFGAPIAHEDHAQRACYAALHLREQLRHYADELRRTRGLSFSTRMGLNSGEVIIGKIGADLKMDYTAHGHSVGLAQRMEALAEPGSVYLTEATQRLIEGFFTCRDLGAFTLKGVAEPTRVFELQDVGQLRTRLEVSRARGLTRFVGRQDEMAALDAALARTCEGHGQVVGVVGEAGVGKSRLCLEFVERCRSQGIAAYEAHCPAHGKNVPFLPILELFRNYFGILPDDSPALARQKVAGAVVLLDPALQETLPVLLEFLGIGDSANPAPQLEAETRQRQLFEILYRLVRAQTERGVVSVTLLDDLHWVDPGSDAFVGQLVAAAEGSCTLVLLNFRPEYQPTWSHRAHYQQLPLVRLGSEAIRELVESLLGRDPSVSGLAERIERWTAGNPFFAEEVIQTLIEGGQLEGTPGAYRLTTDLDRLQVPSSVQAVLAARIDRLPETAKHVLQTAAVIGKEFSSPVLSEVADLPDGDLAEALDRLKTGDLIFERALYPVAEYAFKHPLSHEVAYDSQLSDRKATTHARVARAIEEREAGRLDEKAALIAHHWEHANDADQASIWHLRAAQWALVNDAPASLRHMQRVRDLVATMPAEPSALARGATACAQILTVGLRLGATEEAVEQTFEEGKRLAERAGNLPLLAKLNGGYSAVRGVALGYADDYVTYARKAVELADRTADPELQYVMRLWLTWGQFWSGQFERALETLGGALERAPDDPFFGSAIAGVPPLPALLAAQGLCLCVRGDLETGRRRLDEAKRVALATHTAEILAIVQSLASLVLSVVEGPSVTVREAARISHEAAGKIGNSYVRSLGTLALGVVELLDGNASDAERFLRQTLQIVEEHRSAGASRGVALGYMADVLIAQGDPAKALQLATEAVEFERSHGLRWQLTPWLTWIRALLVAGDESGVRRGLTEMRQRIEESGARIYQPHWHECRAAFEGRFGALESSERELRKAQRLFTEMGAMDHAERLSRELAS